MEPIYAELKFTPRDNRPYVHSRIYDGGPKIQRPQLPLPTESHKDTPLQPTSQRIDDTQPQNSIIDMYINKLKSFTELLNNCKISEPRQESTYMAMTPSNRDNTEDLYMTINNIRVKTKISPPLPERNYLKLKLNIKNKHDKRTIKNLEKKCNNKTKTDCVFPCKWDENHTGKKPYIKRLRTFFDRSKKNNTVENVGKCVVDQDKLYKSDITTNPDSKLCQTPFKLGSMPLSNNDKDTLRIMDFKSSKNIEDPSSMIIKNGDYILYTKNYKIVNSNKFVNNDVFLLCQIKDKKQKLQIRFIPCYKRPPEYGQKPPVVENKYTFMTTNETAKEWAESIAQHSIHNLIVQYYKLKGFRYMIIADKSETSNNIPIHDLKDYKDPNTLYLNHDCKEQDKEQCKSPSLDQSIPPPENK